MVERITFGDVQASLNNVTKPYDIMNAIRNSASDSFQRYVPLANAQNVVEVGNSLMSTVALQNEFITTLVDRIGKVVIRKKSLKNQLAPFKNGMMEYGRTIEEVFIDITKEHGYDPLKAETEVFKREIPDVNTLFHEENRRGFFKQTIQQTSLKKAFVSWDGFGDFIAGVFNAMYNSDQVSEYNYMMLLIDNYAASGLFAVEKVAAPTNTETTTQLVKAIRKAAGRMTLMNGSRKYNAAGVHTASAMEDLQLFITADLQADMDVDVLSKAFNMDKTNFLGHVTIVDEFATPGLEAVLVDRDWFMVYDTNYLMEAIWNPQGLYWNYFLHHWQILSTSRFAQAVAFYSGEVKPVTSISVDPIKASVVAGNTVEYDAIVRSTVEGKYPVTYTVKGLNGTTVQAGTKFEGSVLTTDIAQTGTLEITATVSPSYDVDNNPKTPDTVETVTSTAVLVVTPPLK